MEKCTDWKWEKYYNQLSKEYMSDESDSSDMESILVHKHPWRSESKTNQ